MWTLLAWRLLDLALGILAPLVAIFLIRLALREGFTRNRGGRLHYRSEHPRIFFCDLVLLALSGGLIGLGMITLGISDDPVPRRRSAPHVVTVQERSPGYLYFK